MNTPPTSNTHGGARPGAGRKPKPQPSPTPIPPLDQALVDAARARCAQSINDTLDALQALAHGSAPTRHERWVAAGTLTIGKGQSERPAFPHLPPEQLVLVSCDTYTPKPDARAATYLADRVLGRAPCADTIYLEEQVEGELKVLIRQINTCFSPELAHAILTTLANPREPQTILDPTPEQIQQRPQHQEETVGGEELTDEDDLNTPEGAREEPSMEEHPTDEEAPRFPNLDPLNPPLNSPLLSHSPSPPLNSPPSNLQTFKFSRRE